MDHTTSIGIGQTVSIRMGSTTLTGTIIKILRGGMDVLATSVSSNATAVVAVERDGETQEFKRRVSLLNLDIAQKELPHG